MTNKLNPNSPTYVVGYEFTNKQGFKAVVIAYRGRKDIDIRFEDGAIVQGTTGSYIAKGLPLHPTYGKIQVGDKFSCKDGDTVEVVHYESSTRILGRWLSDGAEKWTSSEVLKAGVNKHPKLFSAGDLVPTNNHGVVEVVEYRSAKNIIVKFGNGELKETTAANLKRGNVRPDQFFSQREGYKFTTNSGWGGVVSKWQDAHNVSVVWQDGSTSVESWSNIAAGSIKPVFQPSVCGIGFVGEGKYLPSSYKLTGSFSNKEHAPARIYAYWQRMLSRCYNEKEQQKASGRAYIGCTVQDEWHNFQNFAEWALSKEQSLFTEAGEIWEIDKDLLVSGNRTYGPELCTFLPPEINIFLSDKSWSQNCPRGVNYVKPATSGSKEGWIARCHVNGERKYLGYYENPMTAFLKYKDVKEGYAKELAEKYKSRLEPEAYSRLLEFTVHPYE